MIVEYYYLAVAIVAEVIGTSMLKASEQLTRLWPSVIVFLGYFTAIWGLSHAVKTIPLGIVYALWSGLGIIGIVFVAFFIYKQKPDIFAMIGIGFIVIGVLVVQLFSKSVPH